MMFRADVGVLVCLVHAVTALESSFKEAVVYPQFLEGRSEDGARLLKINDDLTLNLVQKSAYRGPLLLRTTEEDGTHLYQQVSGSDYNKNLYQDRKNLASVVLSNDDDLQVNGIIGEDLRIKPLLAVERSPEGHVAHLLYREEPLTQDARVTDYVAAPFPQAAPILSDVLEARSGSDISPEVHVVLDSTYFELFDYDRTAVISYFGAVLNAVNLRYETVEGIKVDIVITGFTFNLYRSDEPYIKTFGAYSGKGDIYSTLEEFGNYYNRYPLHPPADVMVLVSGMEMCTAKQYEISCSVQGLAYVAGACTEHRYAACEDKPHSFSLVRTMAHELGHSLGCLHDGEDPFRHMPGHPGSRSCSWSQGFLMSYVQENNNEFRFSPCCSRQIWFVTGLGSRWCLRVNNTNKAVPVSRYLPGSNVSLDQLCFKAFNHTGYKLRHDTSKPIIGCKVPCVAKYRYGYYIYTKSGTTSGDDGSLCDMENNQKICIRGECVYDTKFFRLGSSHQTNQNPSTPTATSQPRREPSRSTTSTREWATKSPWTYPPRRTTQRRPTSTTTRRSRRRYTTYYNSGK